MLILLAQEIQNKAVPALATAGGGDSAEVGASILGRYLAVLIQTSLILGGLAVLMYMFLAGISWITAGGDSGKIEKARTRITQSIMGLAVLFSVVAVAQFIGPVFGLDLLKPTFINQISAPSSSSSSVSAGVAAGRAAATGSAGSFGGVLSGIRGFFGGR